MDDSAKAPRGVEFDDDLLGDVPLGAASAARVTGGSAIAREREQKAIAERRRTTEVSAKSVGGR